MLCTPSQARIVPQIPQSTLEAAREASVTGDNVPSSEVIRVGIGTQNFGTYQYKEITIFGTGDTQIYDNRILIGNYAPDKEIKISYTNGKFNIYTEGNMFPDRVDGPVEITSNFGLLGVSGLKGQASRLFITGHLNLHPTATEHSILLI